LRRQILILLMINIKLILPHKPILKQKVVAVLKEIVILVLFKLKK